MCATVVITGFLGGGCGTLSDSRVGARPPADNASVLEDEYRQALTLMRAEQWQEAGQHLEVITVQQPDHAGPWLNLGICQAKLGEIGAAETSLKASIERNPDNPIAYNQLGILYRHLGRFDEAWAMYEAAQAVAPGDPDTHWKLGILYDLYMPDTGQAL
jgi:Flp pilus assembly protein TadD